MSSSGLPRGETEDEKVAPGQVLTTEEKLPGAQLKASAGDRKGRGNSFLNPVYDVPIPRNTTIVAFAPII